MLLSLRGAAADVDEMRVGLAAVAERNGGEVLGVLDAAQSARLWEDVAEPSRMMAGPFHGLKAVVPPGELASLVPRVEGAHSAIRVSLGAGAMHVTLTAAERTQVAQLAREAERLGGWLRADAPAGRAQEIVPPREPDRVSAAIKAKFDPAGVLPQVPC